LPAVAIVVAAVLPAADGLLRRRSAVCVGSPLLLPLFDQRRHRFARR
jgi:hypothetical protein